HGFQELPFIEIVGDAGQRVGLDCELDLLEEDLSSVDSADLGCNGPAERKDDVAVLVGVLEDWVAAVVGELPTGGGNNFLIAINGVVGCDEIENGEGGRFVGGLAPIVLAGQ